MSKTVDLLMEDFYGADKDLKRCEVILGDMIGLGLNKYSDYKQHREILKHVKELEKILERKFNFARISINFSAETMTPTLTTPIFPGVESLLFLNDQEVVKDRTGYRFKTSRGITTAIIISTMYTKELSAREILAVILHEIGHSFKLNCYTTIAVKSIISPLSFLAKVTLRMQNAIGNFFASNKFTGILYKINALVFRLFGELGSYLDFAFKHLILPKRILESYYSYISAGFSELIMHSNKEERFADEFVAVYGYSNDLLSAIDKIRLDTTALQKQIDDKYMTQLLTLNAAFCPYGYFHPTDRSRAINLIEKLEKELSSKHTPDSVKMEIRGNIKSLKNYSKVIEDRMGSTKIFGDIKDSYLKVFDITHVRNDDLSSDAIKTLVRESSEELSMF